jgi:hypothetical protein
MRGNMLDAKAISHGGQLAAREPFLSGPYFIFKLHHTISKFIVYTLAYRCKNCYLVLNIVKCLNVICMYTYNFQTWLFPPNYMRFLRIIRDVLPRVLNVLFRCTQMLIKIHIWNDLFSRPMFRPAGF